MSRSESSTHSGPRSRRSSRSDTQGVVQTTVVLCATNPEKGPRRLPGLLEPTQLFHGGPPVRFPQGGWYLHTPPHTGCLGASGRWVGRSSASGFRGLHGDAGGRPATEESATGVIHKRPCGWSFADRLRARVDNPERGRRQPEERRSGLTEKKPPWHSLTRRSREESSWLSILGVVTPPRIQIAYRVRIEVLGCQRRHKPRPVHRNGVAPQAIS